MKKTMAIVAVIAMAGVASADLAVDWASTAGMYDVGGSGGGGPFITDGIVQLIWDASGSQTISGGAGGYNVGGGALLAGEFLLNTAVINSGFGQWADGVGIYSDANVGGADIASGVFFTRIFQDATGSVGSFFLDTGEMAATLVYNAGPPVDPASITDYSGIAVVGASTGSIDANATTVIPEPATFGLMGIAGLGMFLARRKVRR
ncbi:MAG: PEP-CTERM sorting domain-containing protein [Sedimenticolaceae bacterium]